MKKLTLTSLAIYCILLTACSHTEISAESSITLPTQFEQAQQVKEATEIQQWWKNWHDPELTRLIEQALAHNLDIALAQSRLKEAQANSQAAEADRGITIGASGGLNSGIGDMDTGMIHPKSSHGSGGYVRFLAAWEPDFFGKKRSDADVARYVALSYQEQVYAAQLLVSSQIAENYFKFFATQQQQTIIQRKLVTLNQLKRYVQGRFDAGQATAYDINEIESQLNALSAREATLTAQADSYTRNIAILVGQTPQGFHLLKKGNPLTNIPNAPTGQLPSDLLERRPDIRTNAQLIRVYSAKLASAKADLFPRFDISFIGQGGKINLSNDLSYLSGVGSLVDLGVQLPIFTNGRISANIDAADARLKSALIQYDKNLLTALSEVENLYQLQSSLKDQTMLLQRATQQAQKQTNDTQKLFTYGNKTLDVVLHTKMTALNYQEKLIQSRLASVQNLINLYKAFGGGWL
ncbi:hypothetical protein BMT54_00080 [Pasteurellaceae bacterium 15-036681]|nr:hypothetical protein BMT54_00080 [Pasteurellaceae bacterium 15-036681]